MKSTIRSVIYGGVSPEVWRGEAVQLSYGGYADTGEGYGARQAYYEALANNAAFEAVVRTLGASVLNVEDDLLEAEREAYLHNLPHTD